MSPDAVPGGRTAPETGLTGFPSGKPLYTGDGIIRPMFCKECGSLLVRAHDGLECPKCRTIHPSDSDREVKVVSRREARNLKVIEGEVPILPTTDAKCSKCGNTTAFWRLEQTRAADEPETRIFRCTKCRHTWREF